jgi:biotin synthase
MKDREEILAGAEAAARAGATRYCMVMSGRGPTIAMTQPARRADPRGEAALADRGVPLGRLLLEEEHARILADAGLDRLNHNLNTSESHYGEILLHAHLRRSRAHAGRGEEVRHRGVQRADPGDGRAGAPNVVEVASGCASSKVPSIPVNFLIPIDGKPGSVRTGRSTPERCPARAVA